MKVNTNYITKAPSPLTIAVGMLICDRLTNEFAEKSKGGDRATKLISLTTCAV